MGTMDVVRALAARPTSEFLPPKEILEMREKISESTINHWIDAKLTDRKWRLIVWALGLAVSYIWTLMQVVQK